jgi:hypothetical protein
MMLHQELGTKLTNMSQEVGNEMGPVGSLELQKSKDAYFKANAGSG